MKFLKKFWGKQIEKIKNDPSISFINSRKSLEETLQNPKRQKMSKIRKYKRVRVICT